MDGQHVPASSQASPSLMQEASDERTRQSPIDDRLPINHRSPMDARGSNGPAAEFVMEQVGGGAVAFDQQSGVHLQHARLAEFRPASTGGNRAATTAHPECEWPFGAAGGYGRGGRVRGAVSGVWATMVVQVVCMRVPWTSVMTFLITMRSCPWLRRNEST